MIMLEKLTRAILVAMHSEGTMRSMIENGRIIVPPQMYDDARRIARAALETLREPTEEMLCAGGEDNSMGDYPQPSQSWPRMIDAILAGG